MVAAFSSQGGGKENDEERHPFGHILLLHECRAKRYMEETLAAPACALYSTQHSDKGYFPRRIILVLAGGTAGADKTTAVAVVAASLFPVLLKLKGPLFSRPSYPNTRLPVCIYQPSLSRGPDVSISTVKKDAVSPA